MRAHTPHRSELEEPGTPLWFRIFSVSLAIGSALTVAFLIAAK
jgi:hypothetical protein